MKHSRSGSRKQGSGKQSHARAGQRRPKPAKRAQAKRPATMRAVSRRAGPSAQPVPSTLLGRKPATGQTGDARAGDARAGDARAGNARAGERLQKVLAEAGIASRRECEQLMLEGRVEVDGQVVVELGTKVDRALQEIRVDGEALPQPKRVYYAVHKPTGVVCTARDPSGRTRVTDLLPEGVGRVFNVGRLDINSEGLILVTNDGALADHLTHPRYGVAKTYEAYVQGQPDRAVLAQLRQGVHLAEGFARVVSVRIKRRQKKTTVLELVLDEGRNREVRRLFARVGHKVQRLVRIAIGPIRLGEMPRGAVRRLSPREVARLRQAVVTGGKKSTSPGRKPSTTGGTTSSQQRKRGAMAGKAVAGKLAKRGRKPASPGHGSRKSAVQAGTLQQRGARQQGRRADRKEAGR